MNHSACPYYDLVSKAIVHFELMGQLLTSQLITSQGILASSGWFFSEFSVGQGRGIFLGTANLVLAASSLVCFFGGGVVCLFCFLFVCFYH